MADEPDNMVLRLLREIRDKQDAQGREIAELRAEMKEGFASQAREIAELRADAALTKGRLSVVETALGEVIGTLRDVARVQAEHGRILNEHGRILNEHGRILNEHSRILNEHGRILNEHGRILNEHSREIAVIKSTLSETLYVVKALNDTVQQHTHSLDGLTGLLAGVQSRVSRIESRLGMA